MIFEYDKSNFNHFIITSKQTRPKTYRNMKTVFTEEIEGMRVVKINRLRNIYNIKMTLPCKRETCISLAIMSFCPVYHNQ